MHSKEHTSLRGTLQYKLLYQEKTKIPPMAKYVLLTQAHTENKGIKHNWT